MKIKFCTFLSAFKKGDKACYWAKPIHNGTVYKDAIDKIVSGKCGMDEESVAYVTSLYMKEIGDQLIDGMRLELGRMAGNLAVQGGFPTKDAAWDATRNRLVANLHSKGDLSDRLAEVECENTTTGATVVIKSVIDTVSKIESTLVTGTNVKVLVAGTGLVTSTDPTSGEGCWLESESTGVVAAVGTVTASTMITLDATFATMPEPGAYRFVVATRGGYGSEYGVAQAKRKVTVVAAE